MIVTVYSLSGLSEQSRGTEDPWQEASLRTTIRAENEVEAHKLVNNYMVNNPVFYLFVHVSREEQSFSTSFPPKILML